VSWRVSNTVNEIANISVKFSQSHPIPVKNSTSHPIPFRQKKSSWKFYPSPSHHHPHPT